MVRAAAPVVTVLYLLLLVWLFSGGGELSFLGFLVSLGGPAAALFAAWTANETRRIAVATKETVEESRRSRAAGQRPILTLEPAYDVFELRWSSAESDGPRAWCIRRDPPEEVRLRPALTLTNWGGGPALDINVEIGIVDSESPISVPTQYRHVPHHGTDRARLEIQSGKYLVFRPHSGHSYMSSPRSRASAFLPAIGMASVRRLEIPRSVLHRIFIRTLQGAAAPDRTLLAGPYETTFEVTMTYASAEETGLEARFEFKLRASATPDAINGSAATIWEDEEGPLRVYFELLPLPNHQNAANSAAGL